MSSATAERITDFVSAFIYHALSAYCRSPFTCVLMLHNDHAHRGRLQYFQATQNQDGGPGQVQRLFRRRPTSVGWALHSQPTCFRVSSARASQLRDLGDHGCDGFFVFLRIEVVRQPSVITLSYIVTPVLGERGAADGDEIIVERGGVELNDH
jgi:hypothetical protein